MGNSVKRTKRAITRQESAVRALDLRKEGLTYEQIAAQLKISLGGAHKLVHGAIAAIPRERAEEVRELELARLDEMLRGLWKRAAKGNINAVKCALRVMARRAAYLGLDDLADDRLPPQWAALSIEERLAIIARTEAKLAAAKASVPAEMLVQPTRQLVGVTEAAP